MKQLKLFMNASESVLQKKHCKLLLENDKKNDMVGRLRQLLKFHFDFLWSISTIVYKKNKYKF